MVNDQKKQNGRGWSWLAVGGLVAIGLGAGAVGGAIGAWRTVCYDCPSVAQLYNWEPRQSTKILDRDGSVLDELALERRTPVDLDSLPEYVPQAFIAIEDKRFYDHPGFDIFGYLRAVRNQLMGRPGGGSTITLQLARHMFIEKVGFDQSFRRKLRELHVAMDLEAVYTKDEILEAYINQINYDRGWYGIESASQNYFGKHASELNPAEAAMLAAVINRPAYYNPLKHPERGRQRRDLVLSLMADQEFLTEMEASRWRSEPVPETRAELGADDTAPYFVEWVRRILDDRFGSDLYSEGYRVYTTLDVGLQERARQAMERGWRRIESHPDFEGLPYGEEVPEGMEVPPGTTPYLQGMFIGLDPRTGDVLALIGGRDFTDSKFNRATQARRQPGSIFKPFVYTAAVASGIPVSRVYLDAPVNVDMPDGTVWSPRNYTNDFRGEMTLRNALRTSINVVAVKLGLDVGLETVAQYAQRMGISTNVPRVPSLPIGVPAVLPIDVAEAYTTFANLGVKVEPRPILRVEDSRGRIVWEVEPETERVLDPEVAYIMVDLMKDVVNAGSGRRIRLPMYGNVPETLPAAGKTGTTNDATDVWFTGFTPDLLAAVWFGFDMPRPILENAAGGAYAAPVWADFMRPLYFGTGVSVDTLTGDTTYLDEDADTLQIQDGGYAIDPETGDTVLWQEPRFAIPADWRRPDGIITAVIDRETGKLFSADWCPPDALYEEIFIPGTEPTELCEVHAPGLFGAPLRDLPQVLPDTTDSIPTGLRR
ncbi:MAG: PBP1A family penicillin-binding protein [Longimicrobiales bacterium]|nr:PBP1A family penicillin-binding protein [Longimicrobiales bacterium]